MNNIEVYWYYVRYFNQAENKYENDSGVIAGVSVSDCMTRLLNIYGHDISHIRIDFRDGSEYGCISKEYLGDDEEG